MEAKSLELKVRNCKGLRAFNFFQKLFVHAVVSIASDDSVKKLENIQKQRTLMDKEGDGNPEWDHEMRFDLSETSLKDIGYDHLFLVFDFRSGGIFGGKSIGEVRVPLSELVNESSGIVRFVSYEIRNSDGKPNGVLNFSFKVEFSGRNYPIIHPNELSQHPKNQQNSHPDPSVCNSSSHSYPVKPIPSVEPAIHSSPMNLLVPPAKHEFHPIRYPSIPPAETQQPYTFQQSIYPPVVPLQPQAFIHFPSQPQPNWVQQYPPLIHTSTYGFAAAYGYNYNYSHNVHYSDRPFQSTSVECCVQGAPNVCMRAEQ